MLTENLADCWNQSWKPRHPTVKAITKTVTHTAAWKQKSHFLWKCLFSVCIKCQISQIVLELQSCIPIPVPHVPLSEIVQAYTYSYAICLLISPWPAGGPYGPQTQNRTDWLPFLSEDLSCRQEQSPADLLSPGRRGMPHDKTPPVVQRPERGMYFQTGVKLG